MRSTFQPLPEVTPTAKKRGGRRVILVIAVCLVSILLLLGSIAAVAFWSFNDGIVRSEFTLPLVNDEFVDPGEQNILIMGMDTRVDENGNPLPEEVYDALQAGDAGDGGYNANVLMLLHTPADRSQTVGISIPRDDYVELVGAPLGITHSKIKEAYGLAMQERMNELMYDSSVTDAERYQQARAAGRQTQIETVSHFLGGVPIDHFVEMTMGGFFYVAEAVAPLTVCVNQATADEYSGADFAAGVQEIDARQAVSFVRQRRDTSGSGLLLTDLDRARRQQAFIAALGEKLKQQSTLMDPKTVAALAEVTRNHVALDSEFDVLTFLRIAHEASQSGVRFVTLPIIKFDMIDGASVNTVDEEEVQAIVQAIFDGSYFADPAEATDTVESSDSDVAIPEKAPIGTDAGDAQAGEGSELTVYDTWDEPIRAGSMPCVN